MNPLDELQLERERTLFMFYGYRSALSGEVGRGYFKLAHSLMAALGDLEDNPSVANEGGYLVRDAFIERDEEGTPVVHVELISIVDIVESLKAA